MGDRTPRFGLTTFDQDTDTLDEENWKFGYGDRLLLDRLLAYAVEHHTHDDINVVVTQPAPPTAVVSTTGGVIPAGTTVYYRTAAVDQRGQEEMASAMAVVHTRPPVDTPGSPTLARQDGGALSGGTYLYALSAYAGTPASETVASRPASYLLVTGGSVRVRFPQLPSGASGWNIYRQAPGDTRLVLLTSIAAGDPDYVDDGSVNPDQYHFLPTRNSTFSTNSVQLSPAVSAAAMKFYRTYDPTDWTDSLYGYNQPQDTGHATRPGSPPTTSGAVGSAPKIDLTDEAEVQGTLPVGMSVTPEVISLTLDGSVRRGYGTWQFVCEWEHCEVVGVRAALGLGSSPAAQPLIATVERLVSGTSNWNEIFETYQRPTIPVGNQFGDLVPISTFYTFTAGDAMRLVVLQTGGGATPTDFDLTLTLLVLVGDGSTTETYEWETI